VTFTVASMLVALALAAAPLDASHGAVLRVLQHDADAGACDAGALRDIAASTNVTALGRIAGGDPVVLAEVHASCICGAQNCPFYAIRITPRGPRVLFQTYGIGARLVRRGGSLPDVVVGEHDSVAVIDETRYAYRDGTYAIASSERVRADTGARKPDSVAVRFAAGASSAPLRGRVSTGWYDAYTFAAERGQRVTIAGMRTTAPVTVTLFGPHDGDVHPLHAGTAFVLPASGRYLIHVDAENDADTAYALTLAIK